jgi:hypothetical protein
MLLLSQINPYHTRFWQLLAQGSYISKTYYYYYYSYYSLSVSFPWPLFFPVCTYILKLMRLKLDIQLCGQSVIPYPHLKPTYLDPFLCPEAHKNHKHMRIHFGQVTDSFSSYLLVLM